VRLLAAVDEARGAFEYDWRTRFGVPFDVPATMSFGEAWRLTLELMKEPTSHVCAAIGARWEYPLSREAMALMDLHDSFVQVHADPKQPKPTPYPRPWDAPTSRALGKDVSLTVEQYRALRARVETGDVDGR